MDPDFWHRRWRKDEIGFHEGEANALLVRHFEEAFARRQDRVFLPLCGKTRDIGWLCSTGRRVVGAELSETAIEQLFDELGVTPLRSERDPFVHYGAEGIDIYVGDIFDLTAEVLGAVDVVYDRAALVALPGEMRLRYADHLMRITTLAPQFLITFEYDQTQMDGPPFAVTGDEVHRCYGDRYERTLCASVEVAGGLKGRCAATEKVWLLKPSSPEG